MHASAAALITKSLIVIPRDFSFGSFDFGINFSLSFWRNLNNKNNNNNNKLIKKQITYLTISSNSTSIVK